MFFFMGEEGKEKRIYMSLTQTTDLLVDLLETILIDVPKMEKGNKTAAQRIRTNTVKLSKVSKEWRKLSLHSEKKKTKKKTSKRIARKKTGARATL
jgi:hypothetical protein